MKISVEIRIVVPKKIYDMLEEKAKKNNLTVNDLIVYAIEKVLRE